MDPYQKTRIVLTEKHDKVKTEENFTNGRRHLTHHKKVYQTITIRTTNNKLGEEISDAEPTKIEETEDIQRIKDTNKKETIGIKYQKTIKTTKIAADMVIPSIEETIEGDLILEAFSGETSRITKTKSSIRALFNSTDIKIMKQQ